MHWVFEIKFLRKESDKEGERLLDEAVSQIKERRYGEANLSGKKLIRVAVVFSEKERQFVKWTEV